MMVQRFFVKSSEAASGIWTTSETNALVMGSSELYYELITLMLI